MRIVHLSTSDVVGGAARAAHRLHTGLLLLGHDSTMLVAQRSSDDPKIKAFQPHADFYSRVRRMLRATLIHLSIAPYHARPVGYDLFSDDRSEYRAEPLDQLSSCDVVNLHWIAGFVDYQSFLPQVTQHTPVVWTLHDMNPFTGGCHYDHGCSRHADSCKACPQLRSNGLTRLSHKIWRRKQKAIEQIDPIKLHIVTPSLWLCEQAKRSTIFERFPISVLPYGLDTKVFFPRDSSIARAALELPEGARVILFIAGSTANRRKGFALLAEALAGLSHLPNLLLLSLGREKPIIKADIPQRHLGVLDNDSLLALVYSAADLLVIPSLEDNLPNTVLESIACGTPVAGFAAGGIPEMVRPGVTGLLAPPQDVKGLAVALENLLQDAGKRQEMSKNCRRVAQEEYTLRAQSRRYVELYQTILGIGQRTTNH